MHGTSLIIWSMVVKLLARHNRSFKELEEMYSCIPSLPHMYNKVRRCFQGIPPNLPVLPKTS